MKRINFLLKLVLVATFFLSSATQLSAQDFQALSLKSGHEGVWCDKITFTGNEMTLEMWLNIDPATAGDGVAIAGCANNLKGWRLVLDWGIWIKFSFRTPSEGWADLLIPRNQFVGKWGHLAVSVSATNNSVVYVNGVPNDHPDSNKLIEGGFYGNDTDGQALQIGYWYTDTKPVCKIADFRIWKTPLTAAEISANYNKHLEGANSDLYLNYTLAGYRRDLKSYASDESGEKNTGWLNPETNWGNYFGYEVLAQAPANLTLTQNGNEPACRAEWLGIADAWEVEFKNVTANAIISTETVTGNFKSFTGLDLGSTYSVRARAKNLVYSGWTSPVSVEIDDNTTVEEPVDYQHFFMYGQSLSTGQEAYPVSTENIAGNYMIGEQVWINYGNKNLGLLNPLRATIALGFQDLSETPIHGAVNHIRLKQQEVSPEIENQFIATSSGVSGESIEAFSKESSTTSYYNSYYRNTLSSALQIANRTNSSISCPAIFWLQGEWNYWGYGPGLTSGSKATTDKEEYKTLLIKLKDNMQADAQEIYSQAEPPLFITYQAGVQFTAGKELSIGMAQLEASNELRDIICAGPVYQVTDVGGHLDGNGYRWYGEMLGKVYYKTKILGEDFKPLQPKRLARDAGNAKKLLITYHVPNPPLVLDEHTLKAETNSGFNLYSNGSKINITKVEVVNDSVIAITAVSDMNGQIAVQYAGEDFKGHGNVRDSDDYPAFFNYENPDKKNEQGQFVFPHGSKGSLIPSSGEPKDENGNVIYDKPYPLYNFSLAFYYEIQAGETDFFVPNISEYPTAIPNVKNEDVSIRVAGKTLFVTNPEAGNLTIEFFDVSGKKIGQQKNYQSAQKETGYALDSFEAGIYIVKTLANNKVNTFKIIL